jgi:hypothetical protein
MFGARALIRSEFRGGIEGVYTQLGADTVAGGRVLVSQRTRSVKSVQAVIGELDASIRLYGRMVILTHPQEFLKDGKLQADAVATYSNTVQNISSIYSFTDLEAYSSLVAIR